MERRCLSADGPAPAHIFPATDLALVTAVTELKQLPERPNTNQLLAMAEAWRPYRSVAARMLWQYYLAKRERSEESYSGSNTGW